MSLRLCRTTRRRAFAPSRCTARASMRRAAGNRVAVEPERGEGSRDSHAGDFLRKPRRRHAHRPLRCAVLVRGNTNRRRQAVSDGNARAYRARHARGLGTRAAHGRTQRPERRQRLPTPRFASMPRCPSQAATASWRAPIRPSTSSAAERVLAGRPRRRTTLSQDETALLDALRSDDVQGVCETALAMQAPPAPRSSRIAADGWHRSDPRARRRLKRWHADGQVAFAWRHAGRDAWPRVPCWRATCQRSRTSCCVSMPKTRLQTGMPKAMLSSRRLPARRTRLLRRAAEGSREHADASCFRTARSAIRAQLRRQGRAGAGGARRAGRARRRAARPRPSTT